MALNIQIFGTKKCKESAKAERYFKERRIPFHYRNLSEKGISKGELDSICTAYSLEELLDTEGSQYKKRNLAYIRHDREYELLNDPLLFKTPIVRNGRKVTVGYQPDVWKQWSEDN
ncbi:MAG: hypothetical protein AMXMBFR48_16930 [Ignavibacteriales bacterium]